MLEVVDPETERLTGEVRPLYRAKQISLAGLERLFPYMGKEEVRLSLKRLWSEDTKLDMGFILRWPLYSN